MALLSFTPVNIQLVSSLALLLSILLQVAVPLVEAKDVVPFKQNLDMVFREWSCNQPKPRLVYLEDEYDEYDPSVRYLPHALVVSRCDRSIGCCNPGRVCSPVEEEEIAFEVQEISAFRAIGRTEITLINHLKCECLSSVQDAPR